MVTNDAQIGYALNTKHTIRTFHHKYLIHNRILIRSVNIGVSILRALNTMNTNLSLYFVKLVVAIVIGSKV